MLVDNRVSSSAGRQRCQENCSGSTGWDKSEDSSGRLNNRLTIVVAILVQDFVDVAGVSRNIGCPNTKPAVPIDGTHPLGEEFALGLLLG